MTNIALRGVLDMKKFENANNSEEGIDIIELLQAIWKHKWVIIILTVVMMTASYVKVKFFTEDTYTSSGLLYVRNRRIEDTAGDQNQNQNQGQNTTQTEVAIKASDINASRTFNETYVHILGSRSFMQDVSDDLGGKFSWGSVRGMTSVSVVDETELLRISVTARTPEDAYIVAKSVIKTAPKKLTDIFKGGEVSVVDDAVKPTSPNPRDTMRQIMMGAVVGAAIGIAYVFIRSFFDSNVRKSEDIEKRYNVYVLGEISQ